MAESTTQATTQVTPAGEGTPATEASEVPGMTVEQLEAWKNGDEVTTNDVEQELGLEGDGSSGDDTEVEETPEVKKYKLKIDGEEVEVDEAELQRGYSRAKAANKKFEEAAAMRKDLQSLLTQLQQDPLSILTNPALGIDFKKIAEDYLIDQLKYEQMSPEQRQLADQEQQLKRFKDAEELRAKQEQQAQVQQATEFYTQKIDKEFGDALGAAKVPKTPGTVKRMAQIALQLDDNGVEATAEEIAEIVRQELIEDQRQLLGGIDPEALEQMIGADRMAAVRKVGIDRARKGTAQKPPQSKPATQAEKKYYSDKDFRKLINDRLK